MTGFLTQALVFFSAAVILVPLCQRLGLGSVLGYLIAGVLVGPFGLSLIEDPGEIVHFSELGIFFLLFLIGLEIQPRKLWSLRRTLLGLGGLQITLCTLVFFLIGLAAGFAPPAAALLSFALSLSSTAFAMQTLTERHQLNTEAGRGAFAVLLAQDLAAIPALALVPLLVATSVTPSAAPWRTALIGVLTMSFLVVAARYLMGPMFRMIANTRSREMFTAATLFVVIGVTVLMRAAGLSVELGTFIAGVVLAESEYRHELEANLEPFRALLMGLFFIGVGMSVNMAVITERPFALLGFTLGYLALKTLLIYAVARLSRREHAVARTIAMTISQGGEFAFVIIGILSRDGVAPTTTLEFLTAAITLSMALNPILLQLDGRLSARFRRGDEPTYDEIKDEAPTIIIAGFGRFGQVFGRIFRAQGIPFVAIDHDPAQIELLRKFGTKVYYGDASRLDLLEAAGAARARYFILAIDDVDASLRTVSLVQQHFPQARIFARARNRGHAFDLMELGVPAIKRETFDASVAFVRDLLVDMGYVPELADRMVKRFREHDELMLREQFAVRRDDTTLISVARQGAAQLAEVLREDSLQSRIAPAESTRTVN